MLLYGCDNKDFIPNADAITELWSGLKSTGARFVGTTHMTLSAVASSPDLIKRMSEINEMNVSGGRWLATNLGVETVAPRMVKKHLGVKTKPFQPEEWGSVVREGRSEEHTSELQSRQYLVCRLLLEKKKINVDQEYIIVIVIDAVLYYINDSILNQNFIMEFLTSINITENKAIACKELSQTLSLR